VLWELQRTQEKHIENNELMHFTSVLKNFQVLISLSASASTSQSTSQSASQLVDHLNGLKPSFQFILCKFKMECKRGIQCNFKVTPGEKGHSEKEKTICHISEPCTCKLALMRKNFKVGHISCH